MDRREFLITSSGAAVAAASPAAAQAEEAISAAQHTHSGPGQVLKLSMPWGDTPQGPADSVHRLAHRFEAMTDGRYRIEIASETAGPEADADIVHGSAHDFASLHPAFAYFTGL